METKIQRDADQLDADLCSLVNRLERFAETTGDSGLKKASRMVGAQRGLVRRHMSPKARDETPY